MRVLFLTKSHPVYGGVERWLADLVDDLSSAGLDCRVGLARGARFNRPERYARAYPGLPWFPLDGTTGSPAGRRWAVERAIRRIRPHAVIPVMLSDALATAVSLKTGAGPRIVYPIHEVDPGVARDLERFGPALDCVVAVDALTSTLVDEAPAVLCRAWIPQGVPAPPRLTPRPGTGGPLRLGFAGRLEVSMKRAQDLADLAKHLECRPFTWQLTVAGEGTLAASLAARLAPLVTSDRVRFMGGLAPAEMEERFYPNIDVLVITSERETGPLVAFEAMLHGCVVVTADFRGRRENGLLRHGENCLVFPVGDMEAAADRLEALASDAALRHRLADRGRRDALREHSREVQGRRWRDLLIHVAEAPARTGAAGIPLRLSDKTRELGRRLLRRRFPHQTGRGEWPHYS